MRKLLFTFVLILSGLNFVAAQSSSYTQLEWDIIRVGFAIPQGTSQYDGGVSIGGEFRYNLMDKFSVGFGADFIVSGREKDNTKAGVSDSYAFVGDYYFKKSSSCRAFIGMGVGYTKESDLTTQNNNVKIKNGASGTILTPRIGYELGHLRLLASYNIGIKEELTDYISLGVAITLGGGYKK